MKKTGYIITQAFAKEFKGIKTTDGWSILGSFPVFLEKQDAYDYLAKVLERRKHEIDVGMRDSWNLDKEKGLDFCITEVTIDIDTKRMVERGWKIPDQA